MMTYECQHFRQPIRAPEIDAQSVPLEKFCSHTREHLNQIMI